MFYSKFKVRLPLIISQFRKLVEGNWISTRTVMKANNHTYNHSVPVHKNGDFLFNTSF